MSKTLLVFALVSLLLPAGVNAKGEGVGLRMEGTVSKLEVDGEKLYFIFMGRFWFE